MSDPGLDATVTLDIQAALATVGDLEAALSAAVDGLAVTADASAVTASIDEAVASADSEAVIEGETSGITASIDAAVADADAEVTVDADASSIPAEIDAAVDEAEATVTVEADTSAAVAEIGSLDDAVPDIEIPVTADTSQATEAIEELGEGAGGATQSVGGLTSSLGGLSAAQGIAAGGAGGLSSALGGVVGKAGPYGAAIAGTVGVLGAFFTAGLDAEQVTKRFERTLGEFADEVDHINVGTLNGDISDLAVQLGTSDEELRNAATNIAEFGKNAGVAEGEVAATAEQILALGLRTRALNPDLGSAGENADRLTKALARGGRALAPFNIALTSSQIEARALQDNVGKTAATLTTYEKAAAGAALATEQLGASFADDFAAGLDDPKIKLAALKEEVSETIEAFGVPLVAPILDTLEALQPAAIGVATGMGEAVEAISPLIPLFGLLAQAVGLFMSATGTLIKGFLFPLTEALRGVKAVGSALFGPSGSEQFAAQVAEVTEALEDVHGQLTLTGEAVAGYIEETSRFESQNQLDDLDRLGLSLEQVGEFALQGAEGKREFDKAIRSGDESKNNIGDLTHSFDDLQERLTASAKNALIFGVAVQGLDPKFLAAAKSSGDYVGALQDAQAAQDAVAQSTLNAAVAAGTLSVAQRDALLATVTGKDGIVDYSVALETYTAQQEAAAAAQETFTADFATLASTLPAVASAYAGLSDGVGTLGTDFGGLAVALDAAGVGTEELGVIAAGLGVPVENLKGFVDAVNESISTFVSEAVTKLPSVGDAFQSAADQAKAAEAPLTGRAILDALTKTVTDIQSVTATMKAAIQAGYGDVAAFALNQGGPEALAAIGQSLRDEDFTTLAGLRDVFTTGIPQAFSEASGVVGTAALPLLAETGVIGNLMGDNLGANFDPSGIIATKYGAAVQAVSSGASPLISAVTAGATQARVSFAEQIDTVPVKAKAAIDGATAAVNAGSGGFFSAAKAVAEKAGTGFGTGFGTNAVTGAKDGTTKAGQEVAVGGDRQKALAYGAGVGVGQSFGKGIVAGIDSYVTSIRIAAANSVRQAEAAARAEAQSHSPSQLFARLGRDLALGTAEGIEDGTPEVVKQAEEIVRNAAAAAQGVAHALFTGDFLGSAASGGLSEDDPMIVAALKAHEALSAVLGDDTLGAVAGAVTATFDFRGQVLPAGTTPADAAAITEAQVQSALDALRSDRSIALAVKLQGVTR